MSLQVKSKQLLDAHYSELVTRFDPERNMIWTLFNQDDVPCFNLELLDDLLHHHTAIQNLGGKLIDKEVEFDLRYSVMASQTPGVFSLGGQLALFRELIRSKDKDALMHYATRCIDVLYLRINHFNSPLTTIALVQGDALGGGMEAVILSDVIIAERSSIMGFPEILFNLFPGMGAYSLVARKIGTKLAEKIILSGKMYKAEELYEMGLVDVLAEDGEGERALHDFVKKQERRANGFQAIQRVRQRFNPVTYQELIDITTIWVESALKLTEKDLKVMDRLVRSQEKLFLERKEQPIHLNVA
jgi:DSF synthase